MTAFAYELAALVEAQKRAKPGDPEGNYAMPWYLVLGEPQTGRSTAIRGLDISWPHGDGPIPMDANAQCSYWMSDKAVFIEPGPRLVGPQRQHGLLQELCLELKTQRPREPIDGIIVVLSAIRLIEARTDELVEEYAKAVRRQIIEVNGQLATDIPVYVVVTAIDNLWGFGDAFRWTPERKDEEPWGFSLPPGMPSDDLGAQIEAELEALSARIESTCFARLSTEDPWDTRTRAFQHLSETRLLMENLRQTMRILAMGSAFESIPWIRALALGSGVPGTGHRLRYGIDRFMNMGVMPPAQSGTPNPGGMPLHPLMELVLLPERDLVPTRVRWRDDKPFLGLLMVAVVTWLGVIIVMIAK